MNTLVQLLSGMLRTLIKLLLIAIALAAILGILFIGLVVAALSIVWSLVRGRKPAAVTVFRRFHQTSQQFHARTRARTADIVDVQAHEVRPSLKNED